ncbi:MAG: hypothetical protein ACYTBJ_22235, partial [Planctomycetota bacterium]
MSIIDDLIDEGVLELYIDPRSGVYYDRSHNGNDGSPSGVTLDYTGAQFPLGNSLITVPDDPTLKGAEGCLGFMGTGFTDGNYGLLAKHGGATTQFVWTVSSGPARFIFTAGGVSRSLITSPIGNRLNSINFGSGEIAEGFVDGESIGNYSGTSTVSDTTDALLAGNIFTSG